jgi:hypothetical protein
MFDGFLEGIPDAQDYLKRLQSILGGRVGQGSFHLNLDLKWNGPAEARAMRAKVREMEMKLRHLRSDVVNAVQRLNADFDRLKAELVGQPTVKKAFVRQKQLEARRSYDDIKQGIDGLLLQLSNAKQAIDENPD